MRCCGVAPERPVGSNQRVELSGCQLDTLIAQRQVEYAGIGSLKKFGTGSSS